MSSDVQFKLVYPHAPADRAVHYGKGTKVVLDMLFSGLVPAVVLEVIEPGYGWEAVTGKIRVRVTADRGPYKTGEVLVEHAPDCVPVKQLIKREYEYRINVNYYWSKEK